MAINSRKIGYLEHLLGGGLPLHQPVHRWPPAAISRLEDSAVLASLSDDDLKRLIRELEDVIVAHGGDVDETMAAESQAMA